MAKEAGRSKKEALSIKGIDHIELCVGNARQSAYFYQTALGFQPLAYAGLKTGLRDRECFVLQQGRVRLMLTSALGSDNAISRHVSQHGDGLRVIALEVESARSAFDHAVSKGARSYYKPKMESDHQGSVVHSAIHIYGDTVHVFVERHEYSGTFLPGFIEWARPDYHVTETGIRDLDHIVGNVALGQMEKWVTFYRDVMGFSQIASFDSTEISTNYTALMSKIMSNGNGKIKFPLNEPVIGKKTSQIEEFLDFYEGAGVQHLAFATNDIVRTVKDLRNRGVDFLEIPSSYYDAIEERIGQIDEDLSPLRELGILVDRDEDGYLLQIFTKPFQPRPTMFFEIIQRKGASSFGKGNFKALFQAIEREQMLRGTL